MPVRTRNSHDATTLSNFYHDRKKFLRGEMTAGAFEAKWRKVRVADQYLFADTAEILEMANAGILKIETLYASTAGER